VLGNSDRLHLPQIAIVGSRRMTRGGESNALQWAQYLAEAGFTITSGLALGVDGAAHRGALQASQAVGTTIAVMATGIDQIYPYRHRQLADQILQADGALITEFAPGSEPVAARFPQRNRIISGLSLGVLVVEAALKSGSLITARYAMEQGREVFAIPGSIHNPQSRGYPRY
jgi:DNA processing protein